MSVENTGAIATPPLTQPAAPAVPATPTPAPTIHYNIAAPAPGITPAPAAPATPAGPQTVAISLEQLQAFTTIQSRLAELEAAHRGQHEAAQRQIQDALLAKGQAEEAVRMIRQQTEESLAAERTRVAETQRQAQNYAIDVEVSRAIAGHQFVNDRARRQFETEVRSELTAVVEGNSFAVRTPTFQSPAQLVAAKLGTPEQPNADYAYLLAPRGVGGTQTGQQPQTPPAPPVQPAQPDRPPTLGIAMLQHRQAAIAATRSTNSPTTDMSMPMGLGRVPVR
jgi:hypothetical protein